MTTAKSGRSGGGRPGGRLAAGHPAGPSALTRSGVSPTRVALALHEAGHAVVGAVYGATTELATLSADSSHGLCTFTADGFGPSAHAYRPHIAAAGAVAAAMLAHGPRPALHHIDRHLHGPDRHELHTMSLSTMQPMSASLLAVRPLVHQCWDAIADLATGLYFGDEISHADVCSALGLTDGGGPASMQLALLRSGGTPGSFLACPKVGIS